MAAGLASILIPDVGRADVALAAPGAATGGFVGAFAGMELNEAEARLHPEQVENGRTVLIDRGIDRAEQVRSLMVKHGAYDYSMSTS